MNKGSAELGVPPTWLAKKLVESPESVRIVDVRVDQEKERRGLPKSFLRSHIPDSVSLDVRARLFDEDGDVVSAPELALVMSSIGVGDQHTVVLVGDTSTGDALAAAWALDRYGHRDVHVLEGGFLRWIAERRPVTREVVRHPIASFTARVSA